MSLVDRFVPIARHRNRAKLKLPNYIHNLLSRHNKAWRKYQSSGLSSNYNICKRLRFRFKAPLSKFFINKKKKIFACRSTKQFFTSVNNRLHPTQRIDRLLLSDDSFTSDECKIANAFCEEFQSNYLYGFGSDSPLSFASRTAEYSEDPLFEYNTVYLALHCTKNSAAGPDHLPGRFNRSLVADFTPSLRIIFQQSFYSSNIPDMWRMAMVRPVFKKGSRNRAAHYRPISLTCVACKIKESIVRNAMYDHFLVNSLLCPAQHGFRARQSTVSSLLLSHNEYVNYVEDKSDVDVILFDFAKEFDVVGHNLLLLKLNAYGFSKYTLL